MEFLEKPVDLASLTEAIHRAKATKMVLVEKETEDRIRDILHHKSW
jgi:FixJ family two-component response regulator